MKGVKTITGKIYPKVGETNFYEVTEFHKGTVVIDPNTIKWKLYQYKDHKWDELAGPVKTGKKVTFNFPQKWYTKELLIEAYIFEAEGKAPPGIIVKPCMGDRKINNTEILNAEGGKITQMPKYGQSITLRATTENMLGEVLKLSLWERDTYSDKGHDTKGNQLLWSGNSKRVNNKGFGEQKIMLSPAMMQLANKSMFEGQTHEYYLLVEADKRQTISQTTFVSSEIVLSKNAPKPKPDTKAQPTPKPIQEQVVVKVKDSLGHDTIKVEGISKVVVEIPDEKDIIKKKGKCFCNRDITSVELQKMVKNIRDNTFYANKTITSYHKEKLFYLYANVPESDRTFTKFSESINQAFSKYNITTCARKIHFLANMYVETMYFTATREGKGLNDFRYDPYRGRGFQHLTWEDNYKKYKKETDIDIVTDYEKVADDLSIAADTGAWYWNKLGINVYADKDSIFDTSRLINYPNATKSSSINGYKDRETAWRELKKIFKYPQDCINNNIKKEEGKACEKCKGSHYDLTDKVKWQTQFDSKWGDKKAQNVACKKTCDDILNKSGLTSTSKTNKYQTALENDNHTVLNVNTEISKTGVKYIDLQLDLENPVQVGVDHALNYKGGTLNEGTTDHFVVIVGKSCENGKTYYRFYDVGTSHESKGTSENNRFYLDTSSYSLIGKTEYNGSRYTVSQIRKNTKK